jgi:hypothetical protein
MAAAQPQPQADPENHQSQAKQRPNRQTPAIDRQRCGHGNDAAGDEGLQQQLFDREGGEGIALVLGIHHVQQK